MTEESVIYLLVTNLKLLGIYVKERDFIVTLDTNNINYQIWKHVSYNNSLILTTNFKLTDDITSIIYKQLQKGIVNTN